MLPCPSYVHLAQRFAIRWAFERAAAAEELESPEIGEVLAGRESVSREPQLWNLAKKCPSHPGDDSNGEQRGCEIRSHHSPCRTYSYFWPESTDRWDSLGSAALELGREE